MTEEQGQYKVVDQPKISIWDALKRPPQWALKTIHAGRLKGKSDINPQWRYYALTQVFGQCGIGWKFTIDKLWLEPGNGNEVIAFATVSLYTKTGTEWSDPIPGVGGSKLVEQESKGPHNNDEAYKMAVTDALSTACKMIGVASDIYMGKWDGSKYAEDESLPGSEFITEEQRIEIEKIIVEKGVEAELFLEYMKAEDTETILARDYNKAIAALKKAKGTK